MRAVGIIPARLGSSRFPNKPLAPILGMPMVGHCFHRTRLAIGGENTFVATCDMAIADYVRSIDGQVVMTSADHDRATGRVAEVVSLLEADGGERIDAVAMVQGDEPLVAPETVQRSLAARDFSGGWVCQGICSTTVAIR